MIQKLKRDTLSQQIQESLIALIDSHDMAPGDTLPSESQLAAEFGVSRPVIREALKALQGEGVIEIVTGKNAVIKPISSTMLRRYFERAIAMKSASFRDLIEVRQGLETQSAMLAAVRATDEEIAALERVMGHMREHMHDHARFAEFDVEFHLLIASAARNPMIFYLIESIRDAMRDNVLLGMSSRSSEEEYTNVRTRHEAILAALQAHDPDAAQRAMQEHFAEALRAFEQKG